MRVSQRDNIITLPVGSAAFRLLWGICGPRFVEAAVAAADVAAAVGEEFAEPLGAPEREK